MSKWLVGTARYDVILGMPWRKDINPCIDYSDRKIQLTQNEKQIILKEDLGRQDGQIERPLQKVKGMTAKCFRRLIRKQKIIEVYNVIARNVKTRKSQRKNEIV